MNAFLRLSVSSFVAIAVSALVAQTEPVTQPPISQAPKPSRYGIDAWRDDYPVALDLPAANPAPVYVRSRRQALERIAANLQGNTRREVWLMATEFFARAPEDAVEVLVGLMDRAFSQPMLVDVVRNAIEAMGRMQRDEFDDALRRAMEHPDPGVRQSAFAALAGSGKADTVRAAGQQFLSGMDGKARIAWLRAVRLRLPDESAQIFQKLMRAETPIAIRDLVLKEILQLPPEQGAVALESIWEHAVGEFRLICAGVLHGAGKVSGTVVLTEALSGEDPKVVEAALRQLKGREIGSLRDSVLKLSTHPRPEVRLAVAQALEGVAGDDVTNTFETLAGGEELVEAKSIALRELTRRGRPEAVGVVIDQIQTATGSRLQLLLRMLGSSGDSRVVPLLRERFEKAPAEEGRQFVIALALCRAPEAAKALFELFMAPPRAVSKDSLGRELDTVHYVPVVLPNLRGQEEELMGYFAAIPKDDHVRRALYLQSITGMAVERADAALSKKMADMLRAILFDVTEMPQLRIQALNALTRPWLDLEDVRRMTRSQEARPEGVSDPLRGLMKDFLFEYF